MQNVREKKQPLVRLDAADKIELDKLAAKTGESVPKVLHKAISAYKKQQFFSQMNEGYSNLRNNKQAWDAELKDRALFEKSIGDGFEGS